MGRLAHTEHTTRAAKEGSDDHLLRSEPRRERSSDEGEEEVSEKDASTQEAHLQILKPKRFPHAGDEHGIGEAAKPEGRHLDKKADADDDPAVVKCLSHDES